MNKFREKKNSEQTCTSFSLLSLFPQLEIHLNVPYLVTMQTFISIINKKINSNMLPEQNILGPKSNSHFSNFALWAFTLVICTKHKSLGCKIQVY